MINFPAIELIDRYAIALVKFEKTSANPSEIKFYADQLTRYPQELVAEHVQDLINIHKEIWSLESDLKSFNERALPIEEIGRRAIEIRNWNAKRIAIKNNFAHSVNCQVSEVKVDHLSTDNPTIKFLPKFWDDRYLALDYQNDYMTSSAIEQEWISQGHLKESVSIAHYHDNMVMPAWVEDFKSFFPTFENFNLSLHRMDPGRYFPEHADQYSKYKKLHLLDSNVDIYRMVMFFDDRRPGQFYEIDGKTYNNWIAGQVFGWKNSTPHLAANLGKTARYAMVATCTKKLTFI
jgi:hypothetical protein